MPRLTPPKTVGGKGSWAESNHSDISPIGGARYLLNFTLKEGVG